MSDHADRIDRILDRLEQLLAAETPDDDAALASAIAFIWRRGGFRPVRHVDAMRLDELVGIDAQLAKLTRNTRQFLRGLPANHVLLWGERGTGKSSAVKALLTAYHQEGLRLVQVARHDLLDLPDILDRLWDRPERYILFCDDLSFESDDASYKELKALLEGGIQARPRNVLLMATSNRRHLMPERLADRRMVLDGDEVHPNEAVQEQLSLADRFGQRIGFYAMRQADYLDLVRRMAAARGLSVDDRHLTTQALRWAMREGGVSGRGARQFVDDLEGRLGLDSDQYTMLKAQ